VVRGALLTLCLCALPVPALAHATAVDLETWITASGVEVRATAEGAIPVSAARLAVSVTLPGTPERFTPLQETAPGVYTASLETTPRGVVRVAFRDTTFPGEALTVGGETRLPTLEPLRLTLPPSPASVQPLIVYALIAAPVVLGLVALVFVAVSSRRTAENG
jgi:hypothetical protein